MEVRVKREGLYERADRQRRGAGANLADVRGDLTPARRIRADFLPVEEEIRFDGRDAVRRM
jgi:hypothetical protein